MTQFIQSIGNSKRKGMAGLLPSWAPVQTRCSLFAARA
jgi:hypothetical protein